MEANNAKNGQAVSGPFSLSRDVWGQLVLTDADGHEHFGVELVRAFPLSDPRHGIAVCDGRGHELMWLDDLDALPAPLVRQIEEELARRNSCRSSAAF